MASRRRCSDKFILAEPLESRYFPGEALAVVLVASIDSNINLGAIEAPELSVDNSATTASTFEPDTDGRPSEDARGLTSEPIRPRIPVTVPEEYLGEEDDAAIDSPNLAVLQPPTSVAALPTVKVTAQ